LVPTSTGQPPTVRRKRDAPDFIPVTVEGVDDGPSCQVIDGDTLISAGEVNEAAIGREGDAGEMGTGLLQPFNESEVRHGPKINPLFNLVRARIDDAGQDAAIRGKPQITQTVLVPGTWQRYHLGARSQVIDDNFSLLKRLDRRISAIRRDNQRAPGNCRPGIDRVEAARVHNSDSERAVTLEPHQQSTIAGERDGLEPIGDDIPRGLLPIGRWIDGQAAGIGHQQAVIVRRERDTVECLGAVQRQCSGAAPLLEIPDFDIIAEFIMADRSQPAAI
jgi:hypothetical protein